jgi:hypothetical protein
MIIFFDNTSLKRSLLFLGASVPKRPTHFHAKTYEFSSPFFIYLMPLIRKKAFWKNHHDDIDNSIVYCTVNDL